MMAFPNFYGRKCENASYFLDDLEMAFLAFGRDGEEVKLRAFPLVLRDEAKVWFKGLPTDRRADWDTLKETFLVSTSLTTALRSFGKSLRVYNRTT